MSLTNDLKFFSAYIHLLLVIKRAESKNPIELPAQLVQDILTSEEFGFMTQVEEILHNYDINLPKSELAYLAIHLQGDRKLLENEDEAKRLGFELDDLIREMIHLTAKKLNQEIICDETLLKGLIQHLNPALYRLTMGLEVRNPIINDIRHYYEQLYNAVSYACRHVFSKYNLTIPSNEIGYLTMHIGAALERQNKHEKKNSMLIICPNGMSTAKMLYHKIRNEFPEFETIDICSLRDMHDKIKDGYTMVVSTVNIEPKILPDLTVISPFLPNEDIEKVRETLARAGKEGDFKKEPFLTCQ